MDPADAVPALRTALQEGELVLYLGAGVSVGSELPTWEHLVTAMYFAALAPDDSESREIRRSYRNYLLAISGWYLEQERGAIDVVARKIRAFYGDRRPSDFREDLRRTLYTAMIQPDGGLSEDDVLEMIERNRTLRAIVDLCRARPAGRRGVRAVITYNYDDLLEAALRQTRTGHVSIWRDRPVRTGGRLPIYHVHGYVPLDPDRRRSRDAELIFSEQQFHAAANDPYHWSNVIQLHYMGGYTGLAIGLSLTDRNLRRLLDAAGRTPRPARIFAVFGQPTAPKLLKADQRKIRSRAADYRKRFAKGAGEKDTEREFDQIREIIEAVHSEDVRMQDSVLGDLGVTPIRVDHYREIADALVPAITA